MSNFYYCDDCKEPVDLKEMIELGLTPGYYKACKECGGTNWHAEIDKGTDYEQVKDNK